MHPTVIFRCDGDGTNGLGHVSRCIALAEAFDELGWRCEFVGVYGAVAASLISSAAFHHSPLGADIGGREDAAYTRAVSHERSADLIVLDGYRFNQAYAAQLRSNSRINLTVIDDFAAWPEYPAESLINFTLAAEERSYPPGPARLLLGPHFFLARRAMRRSREARQSTGGAGFKVGIVLSGDSTGRQSHAVLRSLPSAVSEVRVVLPGKLADRPEVEQELSRFGRQSGTQIQSRDLSELLLWADVAICTGGMVKYEAAFLGAVPLILSNGEGEAADTESWIKRHAGFDLGRVQHLEQNVLAAALDRIFRLGVAELGAVSRRGKTLFLDDPTMNAARHILASIRQRGAQ